MATEQAVMLLTEAERESALAALREACVDGRLTLEEFSDRADIVLAARTHGDLAPAITDLATVNPAASQRTPGRASVRRMIAIMGEAKRIGRWRIGSRASAVAVMGACEMDLRAAELQGADIEITAVAVMGEVKIIVPDGVEVDLDGIAVMGGKRVRLADVRFIPGGPLLRVRAYTLMGNVQVESRG